MSDNEKRINDDETVSRDAYELYWIVKKSSEEGVNHSFTRKVKKSQDRNNVYNFEIVVKENDVMGIASNSDDLYFIFVGSNDLKDVRDNLALWHLDPSPSASPEYHKGFMRCASKFDDEVLGHTNQLKSEKRNKMIYFVGHSKGGAMALTSFYRNIDQIDAKPANFSFNIIAGKVITFGQPRLGNKAFCEKFGKLLFRNSYEYIRVDFEEDIVKCLPPVSMGYEHPWFGEHITLPSKLWHKIPSFFVKMKVHGQYYKYFECEDV